MKKLLLFLVLLGVALTAGAFWVNRPRTPAVSETLFTYTPVEFGSLRETVSATGALKPQALLLVTSELPGLVVDIVGKVNDVVSEGDVVLKLDDSTPRLKLAEATVAVEAAQLNVAQAKHLEEAARLALKYQTDLEKGAFRSDKDQAEAKLHAAQAGVKAAEIKVMLAKTSQQEAQNALDKTLVRVPVLPGGTAARRKYVVLDCKVQLGQMVGPTLPQPLFMLATDLAHLEVHAQVAEQDVAKVKKGMPATFAVSAYQEQDLKFSGKVRQMQLLPSGLPGGVYYETIIDAPNQRDPQTGEWRLRPGMTAAVDLIRREKKAVWKLPASALGFQMDDAYLSDAARARLAEWNSRPDQADWRPLWTWDAQRNIPWPIFVRIYQSGEPGLSNGEFTEVLAWEPGREPSPSGPPLRVILSAPPAHRPGLFEQTNIKL
jgi:HlyD family secretion protein